MTKRKNEAEGSLAKKQCPDYYTIFYSVIEIIIANASLIFAIPLLSMVSKRLLDAVRGLSRLTERQKEIMARLNAMLPDPNVRVGTDINPDYVITSNTGDGKTMLMLIFAAQQRLNGKRVLIIGPESMRYEYTNRLNRMRKSGMAAGAEENPDAYSPADAKYVEMTTLKYDKWTGRGEKDIILVDDRKVASYPKAITVLLNKYPEMQPLIIYFRAGGYSKCKSITAQDHQLERPSFNVHFAYTAYCLYCETHDQFSCKGGDFFKKTKSAGHTWKSYARPTSSTVHFIRECYEKYSKVAVFMGVSHRADKYIEAMEWWARDQKIRYVSVINPGTNWVNEFSKPEPAILFVKGERCVTGLTILANCVIILENLPQLNVSLRPGLLSQLQPGTPAVELTTHLCGDNWIGGLGVAKMPGTSTIHQIMGRVLRPEKTLPVEIYMISGTAIRAGVLADAFVQASTSTKPRSNTYANLLNLETMVAEFGREWKKENGTFYGFDSELCERIGQLDHRIGQEVMQNHKRVKFITEQNKYFEECYLLALK